MIAGVFALLIAAPIARAAWPPAADATPEEVVAALHEEVQQIAQVDREPARRFWAARALDASDFAADEEFVADLFAEWIIDPSLVVRQAALTHFPRYIVEGRDDQRGRRAVVGRFDDPAEEVRSAAAAVVVGETLDDFFIEILPATEPGERERIRENARRWREAGVARGLSADEAFVRRACRKHLMVDDEFSPEAVAGLTDALASRWVNAQREALVLLQRCELPVEQRQKIADAGARSRDPLVRREAMTLGERDPLRLGEWLLSDHDPIVRASAFDSRFMPPGYDARPALFERAFADRDGRVVNAAARCVRARNVTLNLDRDALLSRCRADDVETA
ncbi:MAG TPA: hypothetical protein VGE52_12230, partial [Pirellulales bacterium]